MIITKDDMTWIVSCIISTSDEGFRYGTHGLQNIHQFQTSKEGNGQTLWKAMVRRYGLQFIYSTRQIYFSLTWRYGY